MKCAGRLWVSAVALLIAAGCTPVLNWRDTVIGDSGAVGLFPCRPEEATRQVRLGDEMVRMHLRSCAAAGFQFGIVDAELSDAAAATAAAHALERLAATNIGATRVTTLSAVIPGLARSTPPVSLRLTGQRPGGAAVEERVMVFTVGSHALQASVVGDRLDEEAADTFFGGVRVPG